MKKIAIVTFCNNMWELNYGQVLQCYALQEACKKIGGEVSVIRYREKCNKDILKRRLPLGVLNEIYENFCQKKFEENGYGEVVPKFQSFMKKYVNLTYPCYNLKDVEKLTKNTDILICGSDQIWNPCRANDFYYLNFGNDAQKRIAYAASGIVPETKHSKKSYEILVKSLERFDAVSLRERDGVDILKKYTNKKITDALDPTFLLTNKDWDKIATKRLVDESYIFVYTLKGVNRYEMVLKELKKYYGVNKVVFVEAHCPQTKYFGDFIKVSNVGPLEFLSLVKYSSVVCTDSFHGIAFAINYQKQFCTFSNKSSSMFYCANRQKNILDKCHIGSRVCDSLSHINKLTPVNYDKVEKYLSEERERAWKFLKQEIEKL